MERLKMRDEQEYKKLMGRLNKIEGQVRGLKHMLEQEAYCPDIIIQSMAINAALDSFNKLLLGSHIRECVANDIREGRDESIDELVFLCHKLMK